LDDVENDLKEKDIRGWRKITRNRDAWNKMLKEARLRHGP
jgi:hypothetical protein